jgi:hypothetical protein
LDGERRLAFVSRDLPAALVATALRRATRQPDVARGHHSSVRGQKLAETLGILVVTDQTVLCEPDDEPALLGHQCSDQVIVVALAVHQVDELALAGHGAFGHLGTFGPAFGFASGEGPCLVSSQFAALAALRGRRALACPGLLRHHAERFATAVAGQHER